MGASWHAVVFYSHKEHLRESCSQREPSRMWEHCCMITECLTQDRTSDSCTYSTEAPLRGSCFDFKRLEPLGTKQSPGHSSALLQTMGDFQKPSFNTSLISSSAHQWSSLESVFTIVVCYLLTLITITSHFILNSNS